MIVQPKKKRIYFFSSLLVTALLLFGWVNLAQGRDEYRDTPSYDGATYGDGVNLGKKPRNEETTESIIDLLELGKTNYVREGTDNNSDTSHLQGTSEEPTGRNYYVDGTNGSNTNSGTFSHPWRTLQYAVDHVKPGDTLYVRSGTYNENLVLNKSGVEGSPISLRPYGNEEVTINSGEEPAISTKKTQWETTEYWIIEGFTLESYSEFTIYLGERDWHETLHFIIRNNYINGSVSIIGSNNIFEGNEVDGSQNNGSGNGVQETGRESHHNIYRNNIVHHFHSRGIWSFHFTHDSVFEGNHIHNIGNQKSLDHGIDLDGFANVVWRHIVRNNHIHDVNTTSISLENAFDSIVENNYIQSNPGRGITVTNYGGEIGDDWGTDDRCKVGGEHDQYGDTDGDNDCRGNITGNIIRQNLIFDINNYAAIQINYAGGVNILGNTIFCASKNIAGIQTSIGHYTPDIEILSNIISECGWGAINIQESNPDMMDSNNLLYRSDGGDVYRIDGNFYNLTQYQNAFDRGYGSIEVDPGFMNSLGKNFRLLPNSPAIDAGLDIGLTTDIHGVPRPQGLSYDMGAFEYLELRSIYLPTIMMDH